MRNTGKYVICSSLIGLMLLAGAPASGQESGTARSLGEIARQLKAERDKEKQKPVAIYTNDNLPTEGSLGIAALKLEEGAQKKEQAAGKNAPAATGPEEHGKKYFRAMADKIRSRMEFHQRQLAVLQQQLGLARMQYYPNPQKTLEQESTPAFQTDVNKLRSKITNAEKAVADDQKAMDDLQVELRREGGDPGWIR
jgi:hypothetical protein